MGKSSHLGRFTDTVCTVLVDHRADCTSFRLACKDELSDNKVSAPHVESSDKKELASAF